MQARDLFYKVANAAGAFESSVRTAWALPLQQHIATWHSQCGTDSLWWEEDKHNKALEMQ